MNSIEEINNLKQMKTIDSSELSSDISDDNLGLSIETDKKEIPLYKKESLTDEFISSKKIKEKRPRFNSENIENNFQYKKISDKLAPNELKIKKINRQLRIIAEDELSNLKKRRFTFS